MLTHIVMWKFKDHAEGADKATNLRKAKALLDACAGIVPGMGRFEVAIAQPGLECTYDLVLYSEFADQATLHAYASHPQHEALKPFMGAMRLERQCMDFSGSDLVFDIVDVMRRRAGYSYPTVALTCSGIDEDFSRTEFSGTMDLDRYHQRLLRSNNAGERVLGYLSVLFWGFYSGRDGRVTEPRARERVSMAKELLNSCDASEKISGAVSAINLNDFAGAVKLLCELPQIGFSFATKICAFIDPDKCGVLDSVIANSLPGFGVVLRNNVVASNPHNRGVYIKYCAWLQQQARVCNSFGLEKRWVDRDGVPHSWRALDIERSIYG